MARLPVPFGAHPRAVDLRTGRAGPDALHRLLLAHDIANQVIDPASLLVNRRGLRVLVASAEELASLHAAGRLQLGCEPTAFEQAMRQVRQQLDRAVGQH